MAPKPGGVGSIEDVDVVLSRTSRYATPHRKITEKNAGAVEFSLNSRAAPASTSPCLGVLPPLAAV
jgi:hypothetical protein